MADFTGFTLNGVPSSQLGIVRTSDGSRFSMNLLPSTNDFTNQVIGHDGTYYFGRDFKNQTMSISIAYDNMHENQMRKLQQILSSKDPITIQFDESPYKQYTAISTTNSKLSYVCFSTSTATDAPVPTPRPSDAPWGYIYYQGTDSGTGRIYKGDGTLAFTVLESYARSTNKYTDNYTAGQLADWNAAVGLKAHAGLDTWQSSSTGGQFITYNPGDKAAKPIITIPFRDTVGSESTISNITLALQLSATVSNTIIITNLVLDSSDTGIIVNHETELITGINSGKIYNKYITSGYFTDLDIPKGYDILTASTTNYSYIVTASLSSENLPTIAYDYLFL